MRKITLILSGLIIFSNVYAQIPSGYYSSVTTQTGASLKLALKRANYSLYKIKPYIILFVIWLQ